MVICSSVAQLHLLLHIPLKILKPYLLILRYRIMNRIYRIKNTFKRYLVTTLYLYEKDSDFRKKFKNSKGFCLEHYGMLYDLAPSHLSGQVLVDFTSDLNEIFLTNFKRVQEDVSWFVDKHDYRNKEASWKNSKDSLPRAMTKVNSILSEN